jgi:predicted RNA-binding protein with PUA-like domain
LRYWLVKTEPEVFSFANLWSAKRRTTAWDGVRNYQARNYLRDGMRTGDGVLIYHSGAAETGLVGLAEVTRAAYPDPTQFDRGHDGFDPKSAPRAPRWVCVDLTAVRPLERLLPLAELRADPGLTGLPLLQRGSRLSVQPVSPEHWKRILLLAALGARQDRTKPLSENKLRMK